MKRGPWAVGRGTIAIVLMLVAAALGGPVRAESLSDLNVQDFTQKKEKSVTPARNPFVPARTEKEQMLVQDLRLSGVAYAEGEAYALVSGSVVRVGDRLGGYRISTIERDKVVLRKLDETVLLKMEGAL